MLMIIHVGTRAECVGKPSGVVSCRRYYCRVTLDWLWLIGKGW